ncbi:MAG TPA: hypothetical protein VGQ49_11240 [Bryobacteraceae bacterium]|jgi:hypothetical protein|nr:hypothetical protein [Bryobacteraceae bacterium]
MKVTIDIKDDKQVELVEKLRGEKPVKEFALICFEAGLKMAALQAQGKMPKGPVIKFDGAKAEFKKLDGAAITEALKTKDPKNDIVIEVGRLVKAYSAQLGEFAKANGNRLPRSMRVNAQSAIEKMAFQITAEAIKASVSAHANAEKSAA